MEKVYVALIVVVVAALLCEHVTEASRRSKMSSNWRRQTRTRSGSGSYAVKGTAGGRMRQEKTAKPTSADCVEAGFYPTPGSCTAFYRCVDWNGDGSFFTVFHFKCPVNSVFDDELSICSYASWAGRPECSGGGATGPTQTGGGTVDKPDDGKVPDDGEKPDDGKKPDEGDAGTGGESATTQSPGVFSLTCYQDNKYRRHPLYCNKYYYCIYDGDVWSVPTFTCPKDLVFDDNNQICTKQDVRRAACTLAPYEDSISSAPSTVPSSSTEAPVEVTEAPIEVTEAPVDVTTIKTWEVDETSIYDCGAPGYYPYEADCIRFYKCVETDMGKLKGLLYRCPEGYGYSGDERGCSKLEDIPPCDRNTMLSKFRLETATPLYEEDLLWFFHN